MFPDFSVSLLVAAAMILIIALVRKRCPVGFAILAGGLLIWAVRSADPGLILESARKTALSPRNWDLLAALFAVMVIEEELKSADAIAGMVRALESVFRSPRVTLLAMPAFVGLLPSAGGARFSAPIVDTATRSFGLAAEDKAAVNFWFRHVFENVRPIAPGLILACALAHVPVGDTIVHLLWTSVLFAAAGWLVMLRPIRIPDKAKDAETLPRRALFSQAFLAALPIISSFALMFATDLGAGKSIGLVAVLMLPVLVLFRKPVPLKAILREALDWKLFANVLAILCFIELVTETGVLQEIARDLLAAPLPAPFLLGLIGFILGLIIGMTPGYVGIVMPIAAALYPEGNVPVAGVILTGGLAGIMLTPTHLCLTVTLEYFKADLLKTLWPCFKAAAIFLAVYTAVTALFWS